MRMTAESGDTLCAWRKTSMPSMFGILISVMMTSYSAPSILFLAFCPAWTVSTRCPSRRKEMSSISQMERSSSQTRMLATPTSCRRRGCSRSYGLILRDSSGRNGDRPLGIKTAQAQDESGALAWFRASPDLAFVGLHDLIHNGQTEARASFEIGLERFENLFDLLRSHA